MNDNINISEYRVLARKHRPQEFKDLIGQEALVNTLTNSITSNRIAHAYLLNGVRGVGKTTAARLIAMSLNCESRNKESAEPCGNCNSCISIREDRNIDVIEMDAASKTGVDDIREIIDNVKYKPVSCKYKIFIIDEVHMLSKSAFNALLKTLEEPPPHIKFLFATTEVKKIPITIISRCQRFDLSRIESNDLRKHLLLISKKEEIKIDNDAIALIVGAADGSVRDGLSLLDQAIANESNSINEKTVSKMLGLANREHVFDLLDEIFKGNTVESLNIYNNIYKSGADVLMIFDEMLKITHFLTQIKIHKEIKDDIHIPELDRKKGLLIAEKISISALGNIWQVLFKGFEELQNSPHIFQHGEMLIIRIIYLYDGPSPNDLIKKIEKKINENQFEKSLNVNKNDIQTSDTLNISDRVTDDNKIILTTNIPIKSYRHFVDLFYQKKEGMLHTFLYNDAKLISYKEGEVVLNLEKISDTSFSRKIAKLISTWTGRIWKISNSNSNLGQSLYEIDIINQKIEIDKLKNNLDIQNILRRYPGAVIHSITDIQETSENTSNEEINKHEKIREK